MIALLYETTSKFQDTWTECLGRIFFDLVKEKNGLQWFKGISEDIEWLLGMMSPKTARCGATLPVISMKKQFITAQILGAYITI